MNLVDISDQLHNVYQFDHCMCKHNLWWYIFFWGHGLVLVNAYIIYKKLCEEGKVKPMIPYEFRRLVFLANIDPTNFGGRYHLV